MFHYFFLMWYINLFFFIIQNVDQYLQSKLKKSEVMHTFPIHMVAHCLHIWLSHWGPVMHICISMPNIIGSDNGLSPVQCQATIWTNAEILSEIHTFSLNNMPLKMLSAKWLPFWLSLNVFTSWVTSPPPFTCIFLTSMHNKAFRERRHPSAPRSVNE